MKMTESFYNNLDEFAQFEYDAAEEFYAAGLSHKEINKIINGEAAADMQLYYQSGMNGQEYARMLLNKWSGVPKHEVSENIKVKLVRESLNEGLQDSLEFHQWLNDIIVEIGIILENDSERSEQLLASDIQDDPFETHDKEIEEMFTNNVDPIEAANHILDIMFKEINETGITGMHL